MTGKDSKTRRSSLYSGKSEGYKDKDHKHGDPCYFYLKGYFYFIIHFPFKNKNLDIILQQFYEHSNITIFYAQNTPIFSWGFMNMIILTTLAEIIKDYQTIWGSILLPFFGMGAYRWWKNINHKQFLKEEKIRHENRVAELQVEGQINGNIP